MALFAGSLVLSPPLTVASAAATTPYSLASLRPAPPGSLLVLHAYWTSPDSVTTSLLTNRFDEVADLYRTLSGGSLDLSPTVVPGWVKITGPTTPDTCRSDASVGGILTGQALDAAHARGYDPADFSHVAVYIPRDGCRGERTPGAWAEAADGDDAPIVWLAGSTDARVIAHQLAHSLGLQHTRAVACTDPTGSPVPLADRELCTVSRANSAAGTSNTSSLSARDAAGSLLLGAAQRAAAGWMIGSTASLTLDTPVRIAAPDVPSAEPRAAGTPAAAHLTLPGGRTYWIELALPRAGAPRTPTPEPPGLSITLADPAFDPHPVRLDLHPGTVAPDDTSLQSGQSYSTPEGFTIRADEVTASGASVTLTGTPPTASIAEAPAGLALRTGDNSHTIAVSWMPPADDNGFDVTAYRLTRSGVDAAGAPSWSTTTSADVRGWLLTGLEAGVTYTVVVQAVTAVGPGQPVVQQVKMAS